MLTVPEEIKVFWPFRYEISCIHELLFKGWKLIIPLTLRSEMLKLVHEPHLGVVKCKTRAREFMYWPGMMSQIEDIVSICDTCATHNSNRNRREPMISSELPNRPSSKLGADLFELKQYLLTIDYFSKWPGVRFTKVFRTELGHKYILVECSVIALCLPVMSKIPRYKLVCYK